ncbi:MAG: hypothetical protein Ta2A_05640 [Treponemataceae bacterium]|nr:MAG: hypothetical protein Ta2A_05640 [Treponemataceae bacterium]
MITVRLSCLSDGAFFLCEAAGHAGFEAFGKDIVCASVTAILRTAMRVLSECDGITLDWSAKKRGELAFCAKAAEKVPAAEKSMSAENSMPDGMSVLQYTARFIRAGIQSIVQEYPNNVNFEEKLCVEEKFEAKRNLSFAKIEKSRN